MTTRTEAYNALRSVIDPELDEPITDLGFVRSLTVTRRGDVRLHLRLPTSFCSPNFAYLMASDAKDALSDLYWTQRVIVELDDHHDSAIINAGLASDAGYRGTFGHEAQDSLEELRETFRRKAHTAAMERCLTGWLRSERERAESTVGDVTLGDLADGTDKSALLARRQALGLSAAPDSPVLVDHAGRTYPADHVVAALRRARATRISIDGNAHFCRGLLRTRYGDTPSQNPTFVPISTITATLHPEGASS